MKLIRRHPVFFVLVAIALLAVGAEGWFVFVIRRQEAVLETELNQKIAEIERLQHQRPGPTDDNLRRARDDFAQNAEVLTTMLGSLNVAGPDELEYFKGEPAGRTEAFFDIAQFVDAMRANGAKAGVLMRSDERFGFAAYTNEGPEPDLIRPVYRQRRIVEYLLGALFPAHPRTFVGVQREDPATVGRSAENGAPTGVAPARAQPPRTAPAAGGSAGDNAAGTEIFTIDPQVSARTPGYVDTMAFRLTFTGQTSCLRGFMNALAVPEIPLVVRSVEVEPLRAEGASTRGAQGQADAKTPAPELAIVADNESRFVVTVELFEVKLRAPEVPASKP